MTFPLVPPLLGSATRWSYLMDEVPDVSRVGGGGAQWVLVLVVQGPLVQAADAHLDALGLQSVGLLQLTEVVVLQATQSTSTRSTAEALTHRSSHWNWLRPNGQTCLGSTCSDFMDNKAELGSWTLTPGMK